MSLLRDAPVSVTRPLTDKVADAHRIVDDAIAEHFTGRQLTATVILFSGGNDSTILAHLMRGRATHFAHCNTTIGIEATRQFVRDTAAAFHRPLIEVYPNVDYATYVLNGGFPGPGQHWRMYAQLKERGLRKVRRQFVTNREQRVLFIAGARRDESARRREIEEVRRDGSTVWANPLANWSNTDMRAYRSAHPEMPHNEVIDHLHMSGECLCGSFAKPGELEQIRMFYPETAAHIEDLGRRALANGVKPSRCVWGWGATTPQVDGQLQFDVGLLCSSCEWRQDVAPVSS